MDDGQGLLGSLQAAGRDVVNSEDAIQKIIEQGLSAKDEFGDSKRGTGLRMTRTAITSKVVKGEFLIASGNAAYLETQTSSGIPIDLSMASIHGTVIMLKFQRPRATINIYDYV